jgi:glutamate-1-semialdehyde 2,1-aminomutase
MAAGFTTLSLLTPSVYDELERKSARLAAGFSSNATEKGIASTINRVGSMICPFFTANAVTDYETAKTSDLALFNRYFASLLDLGISIAPSQFEGMFVSTAHTVEDIDTTIEQHREALKRI